MLWSALQFVLGMVLGNFLEWFVHKYFLHGIGKRPKSILSFHWRGHHRTSRLNGFIDEDYHQTLFAWNGRTKEIASLTLLALLFSPVLFLVPWLYAGMFVWIFVYYFIHSYSHKNPEWTKKWLRHHYDHHMGRNQDANWAVTLPIPDYLFGTRIKYRYDEKGKARDYPLG